VAALPGAFDGHRLRFRHSEGFRDGIGHTVVRIKELMAAPDHRFRITGPRTFIGVSSGGVLAT
jgi:hypothetical protein